MTDTPAPRFTLQRFDAPHVITFCTEMGAQLLLARQRQRQPRPARPRLSLIDDQTRLRQDLEDLANASRLYTERMQRIIDRILRPETALTGEPETTVDLWRVTLAIWQRRSEQQHASAADRWEPAIAAAFAEHLPPANDSARAAALAACWDALIAQALDGLEAAAALCTGQEDIRPAYEAALNPATAAQVLCMHIEPPPTVVNHLVDALRQVPVCQTLSAHGATAQGCAAEWRSWERPQQPPASNSGCGLGWLVLLALIGLGS